MYVKLKRGPSNNFNKCNYFNNTCKQINLKYISIKKRNKDKKAHQNKNIIKQKNKWNNKPNQN